jgi:hypothetical protein
MYMIYKFFCSLWYKKLKFKIINIFWDDLKLWYLKKWKIEFNRICTLWNFHIYSTMNNTKHVMYWGNCICIFNNKLQKVSFKTSFIWKNILFIFHLLNKLLVLNNLFWPTNSHYNWGNCKVNQSLYQNLSNLFYINVLWVWFTHHLFLSCVLKKGEI